MVHCNNEELHSDHYHALVLCMLSSSNQVGDKKTCGCGCSRLPRHRHVTLSEQPQPHVWKSEFRLRHFELLGIPVSELKLVVGHFYPKWVLETKKFTIPPVSWTLTSWYRRYHELRGCWKPNLVSGNQKTIFKTKKNTFCHITRFQEKDKSAPCSLYQKEFQEAKNRYINFQGADVITFFEQQLSKENIFESKNFRKNYFWSIGAAGALYGLSGARRPHFRPDSKAKSSFC